MHRGALWYLLSAVVLCETHSPLLKVDLQLIGSNNDIALKSFTLHAGDNFVEYFKSFSLDEELTVSSQKMLLLYCVSSLAEQHGVPILFGNGQHADLFLQEVKGYVGLNSTLNSSYEEWELHFLLEVLDAIYLFLVEKYRPAIVEGDRIITYSVMSHKRVVQVTGPYATIIDRVEHSGPDILFLLRTIIPADAIIFDVGDNLGLNALQLSDLNPDGKVVVHTSRTQSYQQREHLTSNLRKIDSAEVVITEPGMPARMLLGLFRTRQLNMISLCLPDLDSPDRVGVLDDAFLRGLTAFPSPPVMLLTVFGGDLTVDESKRALTALCRVLEGEGYQILRLPFHRYFNFLAIPPDKALSYRHAYGAFIFENDWSNNPLKIAAEGPVLARGASATVGGVNVFRGHFASQRPIVVSMPGTVNDKAMAYVCTSTLDCGNVFNQNRRVLMMTTSLSERGTSLQMFEYAHYAEEFLGMNDMFYFLFPLDAPEHSTDMVDKLVQRFGAAHVFWVDSKQELPEAVDMLVTLLNITHVYFPAYGKIRGECPSPDPRYAKFLFHCVFEGRMPCGDVHARLSPSVPVQDAVRSFVPIVPYIVSWEPSVLDGPSLRVDLGIPEKAVVFCRHGGKDSFSIPFVHGVVEAIAKTHSDDIYFIFMNTNNFTSDDWANIIYLPASVDDFMKKKFIRSCDGMLHARINGETFGMAVAEFAALDLPIITSREHTAYGEARNHLDLLQDRALYYWDENSLRNILVNFRDVMKVKHPLNWNSYGQFRPKNVIRKFEEVFFSLLLLRK